MNASDIACPVIESLAPTSLGLPSRALPIAAAAPEQHRQLEWA